MFKVTKLFIRINNVSKGRSGNNVEGDGNTNNEVAHNKYITISVARD